ncbi:TPR repeat-containing protein associated with Hsp90 [Cytospora mali]|uniref:TPR repeat-containing protein associated with Hsp90 n=1 Tax=Cytospora mali TaxID=578113 RepID=A0A194VGW4_CYTMA|nr:TPR repeat-containing protein associated with Hsp90 [Valsa mali var. pyri (nom. inval.)]
MASTDTTSASAAARERGNGFYKMGNFNEAIKAYKEAASLAPEDPAPLSNMSAVRFEMGQYTTAVEHAEQALQLLESEPDNAPKKQKLHARIAKSILYSLDFNKADLAKTVVARLTDSGSIEGISVDAMLTTMTEVQELWTSIPQKPQLRTQVLDRLPRYKSHLLDCAEYYAVGHDDSSPIIDKAELQAIPASQGDLAFLFAGSGDARHIFSTLLNIFQAPLIAKTNRFNRIHFTALDLKPAALARMVIIFDMLSRYSVMKILKTKGHDALIEHIDQLLEAFEADNEDPFPYLYLPPNSLHQVVRVLKQWREPLSSYYAVSRARAFVRDKVKFNRQQKEMYFGPTPTVQSTKDRKEFDALGVILADKDFIHRREPRLGELYAAYESSGSAQMKGLEDYLDGAWKVNVTLLDADQEATRDANLWRWETIYQRHGFCNRKDGGVIQGVTLGLVMLNEKLTIEAVVGEVADVMERIRYDSLDHRSLPPKGEKGIDPRKFPKTFDRIHMSNVPDYIGGPLTVFLCARPLLREHKHANLRFNNLLNSPMYDTHKTFQAEYLLMPHDKQIAEHFAVVREREQGLPGMLDIMSTNILFMQEDYFIWNTVPEKPLSWAKRMRRQEFESWVYGHLLKICLPYPRPLWSDGPVHAPLNLTMVIRLLEHDSKAMNTKKKMVVAPWRTEFTTLLSIWRRLLPFGVISPKKTLVPLSEILEYQVSFPLFQQDQLRIPHFALVFWNTECGQPPQDIRSLLLDDEVGDTSASASQIRNQGVHIVTTFRFVTHTRTASFWMRKDVIENMKAGNWRLYIWRTDNWQAVTEAVDVSRDLEGKHSWLDAVEP